MLEALLDWKRTCAFARCSKESQAELRELSRQWQNSPGRTASGEPAHLSGWGRQWLKTNENATSSDVGNRVPVVWTVFEAHMTSGGKVQRDGAQSVCYKNQMFQSVAEARNPAGLLWSYGHKAFYTALREVVSKETWSNFGNRKVREKHGGAVTHLNPDDAEQEEQQYGIKTGGWLWEAPLDHAPEIAALLTDEFLEYTFGEISGRQKVMCFFVWHHVGLNHIPLDNPCVQKAAGTKRFQSFYEEVERLSHKLTTLARSLLKTGSMGDADVDPYECLLLVKMLLRALMPKINAWAEAENFPQPPF